jgi:hypothetical protein
MRKMNCRGFVRILTSRWLRRYDWSSSLKNAPFTYGIDFLCLFRQTENATSHAF